MTPFDPSSDLHTYSYGLDTPTKYLNESFGSGLTPSLFGSLGGTRGFTPSMSVDHVSGSEFNPFEMSLGSSSGDKTRRSSLATMLGPSSIDDSAPQSSQMNGFDLMSTSTLHNGRKRALSSPAVTTPGGTSFPFLAQPPPQVPSGAMPNLAIKPTKRPRMSVVSTASGLSDFRIPSGGNSDASPESSEVPTPPDSYVINDRLKDPSPLGTGCDIDVNGQDTNLFSRLQQQQNYLIAGGQPSLSQAQPLPLGPIPAGQQSENAQVDANVAAVPMPPLTRSASKKGKVAARPSRASSVSDAGSPSVQTKTKRAGGGRKKGASQKKVVAEPEEDDGDLSDPSLKRKQFLERNRVAACKSRQKKKEKVGKLEQDATDLCHKNQLLQAAALALRQEILTLRQIIQTHQGCSCEHAQGYLERDQEGRGIVLLDKLAGRTMHLDYSVAPQMGSTDDVYAYIEDYARNGTVEEAFTHGVAPPPSLAMMPVVDALMPKATAAPSFTPSNAATVTASRVHSRRQSDTSLFENNARAAGTGIWTRSAAAQPPQFEPPTFSYDSQPNAFGLNFASGATNHLSLAPGANVDPAAQALMGQVAPPPLSRRQSSAPPGTPNWVASSKHAGANGVAEGGDYFSYSAVNNA
ncbi:bZIP transcription factor [Sporobolomyces koalae]|uniref:bZIP transcription factor n=1 Tax=Sporobolomyces koalae TaxID=500713 RepID=UPI003171B97D